MPHLPFHREQLEFMTDLAMSRLTFLDPFFRFLNFFDTPYFFFLLIPVVWLGFSYKWGIRLYYWVTFSNLINASAKDFVGWPRPNTDLPEIGLLHPTSFGFPSGGAQTSLLLAGFLIYSSRTQWAWTIGATYFLLISFSRLYLGVHYPIDILGGWLIGALLLALFIGTKKPLESWIEKKSPLFLCYLGVAIPTLIAIFFANSWVIYTMGAAIGIALGNYFSFKYHLFLPPPKSASEGIGRSFIGVALLFLIMFLWPGDKSVEQAFTAGLFMSLAASPVCRLFIQRPL